MIHLMYLYSSAHDTVLKEKVAIKKLVKVFQTESYAKHAFRKIRLMKMLHHRNVSYISCHSIYFATNMWDSLMV